MQFPHAKFLKRKEGDKLRKQIISEQEKSRSFYTRIDSYLRLAQSNQNAKQFPEAEADELQQTLNTLLPSNQDELESLSNDFLRE